MYLRETDVYSEGAYECLQELAAMYLRKADTYLVEADASLREVVVYLSAAGVLCT
jgi:hypothetical protein